MSCLLNIELQKELNRQSQYQIKMYLSFFTIFAERHTSDKNKMGKKKKNKKNI